MPKHSSCCCNPVGRHVAVACRYYGIGGIQSLNGDGFLPSGIQYGYGGEDGLQGITHGIQKLFGLTTYYDSAGGGFGNGGQGVSGNYIRGPKKWNNDVGIFEFDSTRDVVILSRSGGGDSQHTYTEAGAKGGHSALIQSRIKASLAIEGIAGTGGHNYLGGYATQLGEIVRQGSPSIIGGGAGGAGSRYNQGGHGGVSFGKRGGGGNGGFGGTQTAGGSAGGSGAFSGAFLIGGSGSSQSGGGGGGYYGGGGGAETGGGGGGSSKSVTMASSESGENDNIYSEDATDNGPGGICDPFIFYYPLDTTSAQWHAGMGGGANINETGLGFGAGYNKYKDGLPGVITAIWIDKYCPCELSGKISGVSGGTGDAEISQFTSGSESQNSSYDLPSKLYICLTDAQYQVLDDYSQKENIATRDIRFTIDNEVYIYLGVCSNAYCSSVRLVSGDPTNMSLAGYYNQDTPAAVKHGCCETILCRPVCKSQNAADCFSCRCGSIVSQQSCSMHSPTPKYCCSDPGTNSYYSLSEGWLWECSKDFNFWYEIGQTPETTEHNSNNGIVSTYEQGCLPVTFDFTNTTPEERAEFYENACFGNVQDFDCTPYRFGNLCSSRITKQWGGKLAWSGSVIGQLCYNPTSEPVYAYDSSLPVNCQCVQIESIPCMEYGCSNAPVSYTLPFTNCDFGVNHELIKRIGCSDSFSRGHVIAVAYFNDYELPECKEVLGMTVILPRCHPDPQNPQITDPVKVEAPSIGFVGSNGENGMATCEKSVNGYGSLSDFVLELKSNSQLPITYIVHEPNLWISKRPWSLCGNIHYAKEDRFSGIEYTDTLNNRVVRYYFRPAGSLFSLAANMTADGGHGKKYKDGVACNPACTCQNGKEYEFAGSETAFSSENAYYSEPYYYYLNNGGEPPVIVQGVIEPSGDNPFIGASVIPDSIRYAVCPDNPEFVPILSNRYVKPQADCIRRTPVGPPSITPCSTETQQIDINYCVGESLKITLG